MSEAVWSINFKNAVRQQWKCLLGRLTYGFACVTCPIHTCVAWKHKNAGISLPAQLYERVYMNKTWSKDFLFLCTIMWCGVSYFLLCNCFNQLLLYNPAGACSTTRGVDHTAEAVGSRILQAGDVPAKHVRQLISKMHSMAAERQAKASASKDNKGFHRTPAFIRTVLLDAQEELANGHAFGTQVGYKLDMRSIFACNLCFECSIRSTCKVSMQPAIVYGCPCNFSVQNRWEASGYIRCAMFSLCYIQAGSSNPHMPKGGFYDVGLHTGTVPPNTSWPIVRETIKVGTTYFGFLWCCFQDEQGRKVILLQTVVIHK